MILPPTTMQPSKWACLMDMNHKAFVILFLIISGFGMTTKNFRMAFWLCDEILMTFEYFFDFFGIIWMTSSWLQPCWWARAELAWAIARAERFSARLGSWPFSLQLGIENWLKNELKFQFSVEDLFSIIFYNKID